MLHLDWLFMSVQSLVSGVCEKSEHFTLFFKFRKLHAFVLGHFECTEFRYLNGKSQIIAALIESRFSSR